MAKRLFSTIRGRLTLYTLAFVVIIIGLSTVAAVRLIEIDRTTSALGHQWLSRSMSLGEMSDRVVEFRLAETYRALSTDPAARAADEALAREHEAVVENLEAEYVATGEAGTGAKLDTFRSAWAAYMAGHAQWIAADKEGWIDEPANPGTALHGLFEAADEAIDALIEANRVGAEASADAADRLVSETISIIIALGVFALALAGLVLSSVRRTITKPLGAMTTALTRLAAGDRTVSVPELHRVDEIGLLAKAFDVFRANARALESAHDATQAAQEHAQSLARHDALTGLPNRRVFSAELNTAIKCATSAGTTYSVMLIDLDGFKQVNDLHGHAAGDLVLCEIAERLRREMRTGDTVARLGGDEFAIIYPSDPSHHPEAEIALARRLIASVAKPVKLEQAEVTVGASLGIAYGPGDGADADSVLRAADLAMYRAKHEGGGQMAFFEPGMGAELRAQAALENDFRKALADGNIRAHYQPLVDLTEDRIYGFEVLSRWQDETRGAVSPDVFIPLAERLGLISALTVSVLRQACRDSIGWGDDIILSLNISPLQLRDPALPTQLLTVLNQNAFPPSRLEIEITETALVTDLETARSILQALQIIGIKISLDDFGTGYSSLYHLSELKFDKVKIDRSFVMSMIGSQDHERIVDSILSLARSIGLPAIAEGIENPEVLQSLIDKGCLFGQGYHFGKAMTVGEATAVLAQHQSATRARA